MVSILHIDIASTATLNAANLAKSNFCHFLFCFRFPVYVCVCVVSFCTGQKFLCSEVIAPIRSEVDDISLYIINFEDLTNPTAAEPLVPRLSKCKCIHSKSPDLMDRQIAINNRQS